MEWIQNYVYQPAEIEAEALDRDIVIEIEAPPTETPGNQP